MTTGVGAAASTQAAAADGVDGGLDGGPTSPTGDPSAVSLPPAPLEKPSTPPPRDVAFEEFKKVSMSVCHSVSYHCVFLSLS